MGMGTHNLVPAHQNVHKVHAGSEMLRTKNGEHNSYKSPDSINQIDWNWKASNANVFDYYKNSSVLLLLLNQTENAKWILPGKLFEYLLANKNVLTLGPKESDVQDVLKQTKAGEVVAFQDKDQIKLLISTYYEQFLKGTESANIQNTDLYLRKNITKTLADLLTNMTSSNSREK